MTKSALMGSYKLFYTQVKPYVNINNENQYHTTLETLEVVLASSSDTKSDPLNPLIDMLSHAISEYESLDDKVVEFVKEAKGLPLETAMLTTLMKNNRLTGSDFPEIGKKSTISRILNPNHPRRLSIDEVEILSARFGIRPSMFFDASLEGDHA